ncbi:hypothetical protein FEDK69T_29210 [Flavobacterium enshiense DK69]|nr:hypothetical protein FEDK69T_29210 [Flavobacterium enshiense DK69]
MPYNEWIDNLFLPDEHKERYMALVEEQFCTYFLASKYF